MSINIYALDISSLDPLHREWATVIDRPRREAAERLLRIRDKARCLGAGLLLAFAARQIDGRCSLPLECVADRHGKPCLVHPENFHFNLSHSGDWVICAAADRPVGVDIEKILYDMEDISRHFFSPAERHHLQSLPINQRLGASYAFWVIKESYMKATGLGFRLPPEKLSVDLGPPVVVTNEEVVDPYTSVLCDYEDASYALALTVYGRRPAPPDYRIRKVVIDDMSACLSSRPDRSWKP